jgi:DTW domain-containing protein YfiP
MIASDSTHAIKPANTGRLLSGIMCTTTAKHPAISPANPRPATALPTMNIVEVAAVAQSKEPTRNIILVIKKIVLIEKSL